MLVNPSFQEGGTNDSQLQFKAKEEKAYRTLACLLGAASGLEVYMLSTLSGVTNFVHELGHQIIGVDLTAKGATATITVHAFEAIKAGWKQEGFGNKITTYFDELVRRTKNGVEGFTVPQYQYEWKGNHWEIQHTVFGKFLGEAGSDAFVSASGLMSEELFGTGVMAVGLRIKSSCPILGSACLAYGSFSIATALLYPLSAVRMLIDGTASSASEGHDFLHIAKVLSPVTGLDELTVASLTLGAFALFPIVALGTFNQYTKVTDKMADTAKESGRYLPRSKIQKVLAVVSVVATWTRTGIEVVRFAAKYIPELKDALPIANGLIPVIYITKLSIVAYNSYQTVTSDSSAATVKVKVLAVADLVVQATWTVFKLYGVSTYGVTGVVAKTLLTAGIRQMKYQSIIDAGSFLV
jgi:hypothetical protein